MQNEAETVEQYLVKLPDHKRQIVSEVREIILRNLMGGFAEMMLDNKISYVIPLSVYPDTDDGQPILYASLMSQEEYFTICLCNICTDPNLRYWFEEEFKKAGKELDMTEKCIKFDNIDQLALDVIGRAIASNTAEQYLRLYEDSL